MNVPEYTLVVGVDAYHLRQLELVWPTWKRHKPSLLEHPMIVFYDKKSTSREKVGLIVEHPKLLIVDWPIPGFEWDREKGELGDKFTDPHRAMMLSGFVYVPAAFAKTPYWLKLDTDVVATDTDNWIDPAWFDDDPAIVSHRWTFTKPADQMVKLDCWVKENEERMPPEIYRSEPLNLMPKPGWDRLNHKRIISWCGFFDTEWTRKTALLTKRSDGMYQLPVPSQDGFLWYAATRGGRKVVRINAKSRGFQHWSTWKNVEKHAKEAMR